MGNATVDVDHATCSSWDDKQVGLEVVVRHRIGTMMEEKRTIPWLPKIGIKLLACYAFPAQPQTWKDYVKQQLSDLWPINGL